MENREKEDLIEWFQNIENEIEGVSAALFHQLRSAYPKEDFLRQIEPSGKNPTRFPEGCERIRNMAVDEFFRGIEGSDFSKPDTASTLYLFWELKMLCARKYLETKEDLTHQDTIEILKTLIYDLSPLLLNIGRFDEALKNIDAKTSKRKADTKQKIKKIRAAAKKHWVKTAYSFEIPSETFKDIVRTVLEDPGVTDKTIGNYRRHVEGLLKEEKADTQRVVLVKRKPKYKKA